MTSPTLRSLLAGLDGIDAETLDLEIHADDAMLAFADEFTVGVREQARVEYFRSGHHAWRVVDRALRQVLGPRYPHRRPFRLLDFGAGHGRISRFLLPDLGTERMVSTEADPSAVDFLHQHFGLTALLTPADPDADDFDLRHRLGQPDGFDAVIALSVLTHLPERTFTAWLRRWLDALTVDGGVLLFTTLGPQALLPGRSMPASGIYFERISESRVLDLDDYGTTWVTPDWLGRTLDRLTGGLARWKHVPRGVWNLQDLWLVTLDPNVDWGTRFDLVVDQPTGSLELGLPSADGRAVQVSGWATGGRRPPRKARVELYLDGRLAATVDTAGHREDAVGLLDLPAGQETPTGFELRYTSAERLDPGTQLRLDVVDTAAGPGESNGHRHVLHAGSLEATELFLHMRRLQRAIDHHRNLAEIFEASRWGKMRRAWMALKSRLGRAG